MLRRFLFASLLGSVCAVASVTTAQAPVERIDHEAINQIKEEGLKQSQVMNLASFMTDVHGPRLTNSPQLRAASEWAKGKLTEWGLANAQLEAWGPFGRGWEVQNFTLNQTLPSFSPLVGYPKAWCQSTSGLVKGEVVYLNAKNDAELATFKGKLKGAIVLIAPPTSVRPHFEPEGRRYTDELLLAMANAELPGAGAGAPTPRQPGAGRPPLTEAQRAAFAMTTKKWRLVYEEGAAVVLEPSRGGDGGSLFIGAATMPPASDPQPGVFARSSPWAKDAKPAIPQFVLSPDYYNRMVRALERGAKVAVEASVTAKFYDEDLNGYNVIAELAGSDLRDEIVMIGAHYDSWHSSTGATDNAAGSAVAMEALRIIQAVGLKPRRTIRIGLWTGEEQGLLGSRAHVAKYYGARAAGPAAVGGVGGAFGAGGRVEIKPDHAKFAAYFNLDNGTGKVRGIYLQGNEACRPIFRAWLAPFRELGASTITPQNTGGTDHQSFDGVGLPGFQFIQDPIEYGSRTHHTNIDNFDRLIEDDLKQAATIMAAFAYNAAMRNEKLPRKPMPAAPAAPATNR